MADRSDKLPSPVADPSLVPVVDYRQVFDHAPALLLLLAPDAPRFTILAASDAYLKATQTHREVIVGRGLFEAFPDNPDDKEATGTTNLRASLETVLATRAAHTMAVQKYDIRHPAIAGGGYVVHYWAPVNTPVLTADGRVQALIHRVDDVTDLEQAKRTLQRDGDTRAKSAAPATVVNVRGTELLTDDTRERYRQKLARITLDSMVQFVGLLDAQGTVREINQVALDGVGIRLSDVEGRPFWTTFWWQVSPAINQELQDMIHRAAAGEFVRWDSEIYGRAGGTETIIIDASLMPVKDHTGRVVFITAEGRDITEKKAQEREIARQREELAKLDELKTRFFANISHEFRTPLTLMTGPLEDMLARPGELTAANREHLELAHRNAQRLLKLVNTLLDFSRIEAGRIQASYEPTDLAALTTDLASLFRSAMERAGLKLTVDCPPLPSLVHVDREMWEKIVLNLLSNAFKFTFEGGIDVSLRTDGAAAVLMVRDTGTGIPAEELPQLFDRFHRVKGARGRSYEGSGIGLALVQELAKLHGGHVRVESEVDRGSRFIVTIPFGTAHLPADRVQAGRTMVSTAARAGTYVEEVLRWLPADPAATPPVPVATGSRNPFFNHPDGSPRRILLADDNADMRDYVRGLLVQQGYEVDAVTDGEAALAHARRRRPDLVLTDVMMPGLDGFGLLRELRADAGLATTPVILLSARAGEEARIEGLQAGADDYVTKPFSARELLARIESQVLLAALRRDNAAALDAAVLEKERQQRLYNTVASATPDLIYVFDLDHRFSYANEALLAMWGRTWEEAIGKNCLELGYEPWHAAMHDREIEQVIATKRGIRGEVAFDGTNGRRMYDYIFSPVIGANGEVEAIAGTTRDVTEQHKSAADARFVADLMQQLVSLDAEQDIVWQTVSAVGRHFNVHRCYFVECLESRNLVRVGQNWIRDGAPSLAGEFSLYDFGGVDWWRKYSAGDFAVENVERHPLISREAAANYISLGVRAYAVQPIKRTGEWTVVLGVTEDRTRIWSVEELRLLDHVAARVWPLVERVRAETQLRAARDEAIAASRAKDDFLAVLSHELRTPLNPVLLVASESAADPGLAEEVRGDFKMISDNISLQARLIDDLLDFNRIIHGKVALEKRPLDLHAVVRDATVTLQEEIAAKRIGVTFALHARDHTVHGDPVRLRQVFWNLLKNAVKFTSTGGRVEISSPEDSLSGEVELRIRDSGIGMSSDELARIFQPFVQGEHAGEDHEAFGGLGLGLAISRMLVELHGGRLAAESPGTGLGATIVVRLPLAVSPDRDQPSAHGNGTSPDAEPSQRTHRVLFVEDHEPTRTAMTRLLKRRGYDVSIARSVQDGLEQARDSLFDVLISDLGLPDGDGCELMIELKKKIPEIRGIALSGYGMDSDLTRTRDAGFSDHLIKPVSVDSLDRAMLRLLESDPAAPRR